jgi:hypothetical protein
MARYVRSEIEELRKEVVERLKLPPGPLAQYEDERPTSFWERVEELGLLVQALEVYDQLAADAAEERGLKRETKKEFQARMECEGRLEEAERLRAELVASGLSQREVQEELVERLQPLDGARTRPWSTPDPWECGRLFRKKAFQIEMRSMAADDDEPSDAELARFEIEQARWRQEERQALRAARRRAYQFKQEALVTAG